MYDDYSDDMKGGSFDSDFTKSPNKRRVRRKKKKKRRGSSFEEGPINPPPSPLTQDNTLSPGSGKRRRRKKITPATPLSPVDPILLPSANFRHQQQQPQQPDFKSWPKTANTGGRETNTTGATDVTSAPIGTLSPPPGFGFIRKKKRKKKRKEREQRGATRSLFQQITGLFRQAQVSEFKAPPNRISNGPDLQVQVIENGEENMERISLGSVEEALAKARNLRQPTAARRLFSAAIQTMDPRQYVSVRGRFSTGETNSNKFNNLEEQFSSPNLNQKQESKEYCCPPCFYYLLFLVMMGSGIAIIILAIQGQFD